MAQKLEDLLGPWERVVFRSDGRRWHIVSLSTILGLLTLPGLALFLWFALSNPVNSPAGISSLVMVLFAGYVVILHIGTIVRARRRKLLVTDNRVLYRHGTWRSKITEIELADITGIVVRRSRGRLGQMAWIERGQRGAIIIWWLPGLDQMSNAIAGLTHIPVLRRNEKAVRRAIICLGIGAGLGGLALGLLPTLGLVFLGGGGNFWEFGTIFWDYVFLYPAESTYSAIAVAVAGAIGFVAYMWLIPICFFAGWLLGYFPVLVILRYFLTPDQAHKTICASYPSLPSNGFGKVYRWHARQMARFASWLYGQEIRCD